MKAFDGKPRKPGSGTMFRLPPGFGKVDIHIEKVEVTINTGEPTPTKSKKYEGLIEKKFEAAFVMASEGIKKDRKYKYLVEDPVIKKIEILRGVDIEGNCTGDDRYALVMIFK